MSAIGAATAMSAINGLFDFGFGAATSAVNNAIYKKTYKELGEWQNDMNIANWNMVNEYNSPENQIKRLSAAGLNPNLMYGQGSPGQASPVQGVSGNGGNFNMKTNPINSLAMYQGALAAEGQKIQNDRDELAYQREVNNYENQLRQIQAIRQFMSDKLGNKLPQEVIMYNVGRNGHYSHIRGWSDEELRNSPEYETLNQLWTSGAIKSQDFLKLIEQTSNLEKEGHLLDFENWQNEGIKSLFNDSGELKGAVGMFYKLLQLFISVVGKGKK